MQLLTFLPNFNFMNDLKVYWLKINSKQKLKLVIENLKELGLIEVEKSEDSDLGEEWGIFMPSSVRFYLQQQLHLRKDVE